jgi:two-component system sensor kinase FixL
LQAELAHVGRVSEMASLASSLAHELNQPLTAIANYCEAARDLLPAGQADESLALVREALDEAAKETIRAGQIVQRLREFVRPGESSLRVESLARLVTEANALALVGSREHGVEVQVQLDPSADEIFVDRIQVQQVLTNLIRNAIDAMLESPVRSLKIFSAPGPDDFVTVTVEDTGSGIDSTIAEQLFQPFVTSKEAGMGVGLSICRTIVEGQGGRIWFEPRPEGGTAFHFTLPSGGGE